MDQLDNVIGQRDISGQRALRRVSLTPVPAEEHSQDASAGDDEAAQIEAALQPQLLSGRVPTTPQPELRDRGIPATPRPNPSTISIDQWITTPELQVISEASSSFLMLDGLPTVEQPTWVIPVVRDEGRVGTSAPQY